MSSARSSPTWRAAILASSCSTGTWAARRAARSSRRPTPSATSRWASPSRTCSGVAAGMAKMGCIPFISTFVAFALHRPLDQVRVLIAQTGANVKITAGYTGLLHGACRQDAPDRGRHRHHPGHARHGRRLPGRRGRDARSADVGGGYEGPVFIRLVRDATQTLFEPGLPLPSSAWPRSCAKAAT